MKEVTIVGSLTYGAEVFKGKRTDTFARAIDFVARRRADLSLIKPRKYPLDQYRKALTEAAGEKEFWGGESVAAAVTRAESIINARKRHIRT